MSEIRELPNELLEIAVKELNEVPGRLESELESLQKWIELNPHLQIRSEKQFLVSFLRGCKFNTEKVKQKLELFYSVRQNSPEIMANRDPNEKKIVEMIKQG